MADAARFRMIHFAQDGRTRWPIDRRKVMSGGGHHRSAGVETCRSVLPRLALSHRAARWHRVLAGPVVVRSRQAHRAVADRDMEICGAKCLVSMCGGADLSRLCTRSTASSQLRPPNLGRYFGGQSHHVSRLCPRAFVAASSRVGGGGRRSVARVWLVSGSPR
jgi:hypothetical protein